MEVRECCEVMRGGVRLSAVWNPWAVILVHGEGEAATGGALYSRGWLGRGRAAVFLFCRKQEWMDGIPY